uniref:t-SNARE coiled-coil homology domain-containing protein n=1 Tax=Oncorhynchus mykiss TaxID=8022 RepID=A0A8C7WAE3_ONCMY
MSSEEFEKLQEIFKSLYDELKLMPDRLLKCQGEEKKRLVRTFDERHGEAVEVTQLQSQRALLIQGHEHLNNASQSIERSQRIAAETDQIGVDIIEELGEQREQLDRTRDRLVNTGENLSRSRKILRAMSRRLMTNKLLLSVIILMELVILGAVVYLKFFRK